MKHLQIFALMLVPALVCISAGPVPESWKESSSLPLNTTQLPDSDQQNSTSFEMGTNTSLRNVLGQDSVSVFTIFVRQSDCPLSTCVNINLGNRIQQGDETAGSATRDSEGFGKK